MCQVGIMLRKVYAEAAVFDGDRGPTTDQATTMECMLVMWLFLGQIQFGGLNHPSPS